MQKIYVPTIGDTLTLAQPWKFNLKGEYRNESLQRAIDPQCDRWTDRLAELPAGTVLKVSRVYIRANGPASRRFDSLSFTTKYNGKGVRFFAALSDVNQMVVK